MTSQRERDPLQFLSNTQPDFPHRGLAGLSGLPQRPLDQIYAFFETGKAKHAAVIGDVRLGLPSRSVGLGLADHQDTSAFDGFAQSVGHATRHHGAPDQLEIHV